MHNINPVIRYNIMSCVGSRVFTPVGTKCGMKNIFERKSFGKTSKIKSTFGSRPSGAGVEVLGGQLLSLILSGIYGTGSPVATGNISHGVSLLEDLRCGCSTVNNLPARKMLRPDKLANVSRSEYTFVPRVNKHACKRLVVPVK